MDVGDRSLRVRVDLYPPERHAHGGGHRFETKPFEVLDQIDTTVDSTEAISGCTEKDLETNVLREGVQPLGVAGSLETVDGRTAVMEPRQDYVLCFADDAVGMVHDAPIPHLHPLEQIG